MILKKRTREIIKKKLIRKPSSKGGFTLIEILIVIGIIAILASVVLIAINPARQFKLARDSQRMSNITAILNSIGQIMAENKGKFMCSNTEIIIPTAEEIIGSSISDGQLDIAGCLVPDYISSLPFDPGGINGEYYFTDSGNYNTGYKIVKDPFGRITISAEAEISGPIKITR